MDRGLKQAELGERVGLGQTAISRLEAGEREAGVATVVALAAALDVESADLLHGVGLDGPRLTVGITGTGDVTRRDG